MFTGLIERVGRAAEVTDAAGVRRLRVETPFADPLRLGESVAVNGVCLTVTAVGPESAVFDVSPETLAVTALADIAPGDELNLERALRAHDRVGGHFVQGHVDATGTLTRVEPDGECWRITVAYPAVFARHIILRGSIAVDGISLTVAALDATTFGVQIIPHTWRATALCALRPGDRVNLEFDMLGKYVLRALEFGAAAAAPAREDRPL